eukprot:2836124-Rhodomonas_salina.1
MASEGTYRLVCGLGYTAFCQSVTIWQGTYRLAEHLGYTALCQSGYTVSLAIWHGRRGQLGWRVTLAIRRSSPSSSPPPRCNDRRNASSPCSALSASASL